VTRSEIFEVVKTNIYKIVEEAKDRDIMEEMKMSDLGADSLQIVEVVSRSMKELRLKVPRTDLMKAGNLKELIDLFERAESNPPRS
jgi:acyl carrier protein